MHFPNFWAIAKRLEPITGKTAAPIILQMIENGFKGSDPILGWGTDGIHIWSRCGRRFRVCTKIVGIGRWSKTTFVQI